MALQEGAAYVEVLIYCWDLQVRVGQHRQDLGVRHEPGEVHPAAEPLRAALQRRAVRPVVDQQQLGARGQPGERLQQRADVLLRRPPNTSAAPRSMPSCWQTPRRPQGQTTQSRLIWTARPSLLAAGALAAGMSHGRQAG
jgi:hypothetical protein